MRQLITHLEAENASWPAVVGLAVGGIQVLVVDAAIYLMGPRGRAVVNGRCTLTRTIQGRAGQVAHPLEVAGISSTRKHRLIAPRKGENASRASIFGEAVAEVEVLIVDAAIPLVGAGGCAVIDGCAAAIGAIHRGTGQITHPYEVAGVASAR